MSDDSSSRVVLVEDHQMLRELLVPILHTQCRCSLAAAVRTVAEGIDACFRERPDIVITDWLLSDGQGFDIVRAVSSRLPATRWIFLSSHDQGRLVREAVALRVHGFVMKSGSLETLQTAVREVMAGRRYYCRTSTQMLVNRMADDGFEILEALTTREWAVLRAYAMGENIKVIAARFGMSTRTAQNHLSIIREKLGVHEPAALVRYAIRHGLAEHP